MFEFSPEHGELRAGVRRFLAERSPEAEVRRLMETADGYDTQVWDLMAGGLGLQGLLIPERFGGAGAGLVELQIACEEMGRALLCAPFLSSAVLATSVLLNAGDEDAEQRYLPGLADGTTIGTVALDEESGDGALDTGAVRRGDRYLITGEKLFVLDGVLADLVLVVAGTDRGTSLFAVPAGAAGLEREAMTTLDATRKQARVRFADTPGVLVGHEGGAADAVAAALDVAVAALSAEQVGGARRVLEMAVDYAKIREQFGRPIGSFQAIKHKCADMLVDVESATSAAYAAGWAADQGDDEAGLLANLAKSFCSEAFYRCAAENIQIHGGIGFTWEHPAHLYFKRATSTRLLFGSPRRHRDLLARRLGI
jgi:alkylation response protein AidB-like acyl-CoA dehydrogenase